MPLNKSEAKILTRCVHLARKECCNFCQGTCCETEAKCSLINGYPNIHDGAINCDWFMNAVLPLDKELLKIVLRQLYQDETLYEDSGEPAAEKTILRCCAICGKEFLPIVHNQKYCSGCRSEGKRQHDKIWRRKKRNGK